MVEKPRLALPERIPCLALNQPYAALLFGDEPGKPGPKSLETRLWAWPYPPGWLAIYATKSPDHAACNRLFAQTLLYPAVEITGAILGIVWVAGCRRMTAADNAIACFPFDPQEEAREGRPRLGWPITAAHRFLEPDKKTLARGPQKFVFLPKSVIAFGLWGAADADLGQLTLGARA